MVDPTDDRLELDDDLVRLAVSDPTGSRPTILLTATGAGMTATVELSATGSYALGQMLQAASVRAAAFLPDAPDG